MEEKEQEQIKKETKELLDKFSKALDKVKFAKESNVVRDEDRRKERKEGKICNEEFRRIMFENAPQKDDDFIIAEKKSW